MSAPEHDRDDAGHDAAHDHASGPEDDVGDDDDEVLGGRVVVPTPPSDEQPIVLDDSDESDHWRARRPLEPYDPVASLPLVAPDVPLPEPELPDREPEAEGEGSLSRAWTRLEIRTPLDELDAFAAGRIEALARLGQAERATLARDAAELARDALRQAMGATPREAAP